MKGEIKYMHHISNANGEVFFNDVKRALESGNFEGLHVEIQYSTATDRGNCVFSVLLIGRAQ